MKQVQPEYLDVIRSFFGNQTNVGILGGRPGEAYFLVGLQDEFLVFLDPHNTLEAVPNDIVSIRQNHMSYHESTAKKIHFSKLDPSLGFAFLLKKKSDYEKMKDFMELGKRIHKKNWIFHAMQTKPDYMRTKPKKRESIHSRSASRDKNNVKASDFEQVNGLSEDSDEEDPFSPKIVKIKPDIEESKSDDDDDFEML